MKKIDIQINKAQISSFECEFRDDEAMLPDVTATIGLFAGNKRVSSFSLSTKTYYSTHFELPISILQKILDISKELEDIVTVQCSGAMGELSEPKKDE